MNSDFGVPLVQPDGGSPEVWDLVDRALLAIADDRDLAPALKARLCEAATGLSYRQIAGMHGVSLNTVKTQMRTLLGCLGVSCCHEIADAARAAHARAQAGATAEEVSMCFCGGRAGP